MEESSPLCVAHDDAQELPIPLLGRRIHDQVMVDIQHVAVDLLRQTQRGEIVQAGAAGAALLQQIDVGEGHTIDPVVRTFVSLKGPAEIHNLCHLVAVDQLPLRIFVQTDQLPGPDELVLADPAAVDGPHATQIPKIGDVH